MTASTALPATMQIRRSRFLGLLGSVAIATAVITWALSTVAFNDSGATARSTPRTASPTATSSAAADAQRVPSIMTLTPARLAAGALGTGYALPTADRRPTVASALASMSAKTRRYTKSVMNLTFAQLAAGAAGHP